MTDIISDFELTSLPLRVSHYVRATRTQPADSVRAVEKKDKCDNENSRKRGEGRGGEGRGGEGRGASRAWVGFLISEKTLNHAPSAWGVKTKILDEHPRPPHIGVSPPPPPPTPFPDYRTLLGRATTLAGGGGGVGGGVGGNHNWASYPFMDGFSGFYQVFRVFYDLWKMTLFLLAIRAISIESTKKYRIKRR